MPTKLSASAGVVCLVVHLAVLAQAQAPAPAQRSNPPTYPLWEFGTIPRPAYKRVLLNHPAVQDELKITEAQRKGIREAMNRQFEKVQKARRSVTDQTKFMAAREEIVKESQTAILGLLEPAQRNRLDQIQLQSQGPLAFNRSTLREWNFDEGIDVPQRLKLTDDQVKRVQQIAADGDKEIDKAAAVPIVLDTKAGAPTPESIKTLVASLEFQAAKRKARGAAHKAWAGIIQRIEQVLTEPQRTAYRELIGAPFDMAKIRFGDEADEDIQNVAQALNVGGGAGGGGGGGGGGAGGGGGGGQQADPDFDTKVAHPAYVNTHPKVLFDEAHNNFHTADGRYKPFAELVGHDGYQVIPNKQPFTRALLDKGDILIIANALGDNPGAGSSAFTPAECDAVRDWVKTGGALLLITDHDPFGAGSEPLAQRFGVGMSKSFTSDPQNSEGGATWLVFTRKNHLLGDHPITQGREASERINRIQTFTGQSLKGPAEAVAILKLGDSAVDAARGNASQPISAAGRAQGLALSYGKGRVVILGEAAELSAQRIGTDRFGMNVPGLDNRQFALNIMHWLSGLLEPSGQVIPKKAG